jgi:hypothetical protein
MRHRDVAILVKRHSNRLRYRIGRNVFLKLAQPCQELGIFTPPCSRKTQIEIPERTGERDAAGVEHGVKRTCPFLEYRKASLYLSGLVVEPSSAMVFGIAETGFVNPQQRGIHDAIGQRLACQDAKPGKTSWDDAAATSQMIEIFEDDAAVVKRRAVIEQQNRYLAKRILRAQRILCIVGVGRNDGDTIDKPEIVGRDLYFSPKRRGGGGAQLHGKSQ